MDPTSEAPNFDVESEQGNYPPLQMSRDQRLARQDAKSIARERCSIFKPTQLAYRFRVLSFPGPIGNDR